MIGLCLFLVYAARRVEALKTPTLSRRLAVAAPVLGVATKCVAVRPPEFVQKQAGFTQTGSGLQYKDGVTGKGAQVENGDRVVYEWEGYTIGYFGRPFEKKNSIRGGDFASDRDFDRFIVGRGQVIPALEEGVVGMREGGVRQIVFGPNLGYPFKGDEIYGVLDDPNHDRVGPKPNSFSGMRALNFVLSSKGDNAVDKTLLINVRVIRVDKGGTPSRRSQL